MWLSLEVDCILAESGYYLPGYVVASSICHISPPGSPSPISQRALNQTDGTGRMDRAGTILNSFLAQYRGLDLFHKSLEVVADDIRFPFVLFHNHRFG